MQAKTTTPNEGRVKVDRKKRGKKRGKKEEKKRGKGCFQSLKEKSWWHSIP
jgi:hypothetical protein